MEKEVTVVLMEYDGADDLIVERLSYFKQDFLPELDELIDAKLQPIKNDLSEIRRDIDKARSELDRIDSILANIEDRLDNLEMIERNRRSIY